LRVKRTTHVLMGVAAAAPVALTLPPLGAAAALWFGAVGGGAPDYLDLRSEARRVLRHRGASHGLFVVALVTAAVWFLLDALHRSEARMLDVPARYVTPWSLAVALGMVSHLLGDACTRAGIRPLLPVIGWRFWLLPRFVRGRSDGPINGVARVVSCLVLGIALAVYVMAY
jgi:membrane-bound metal-dependent hydrolase YbcI (DUF457 family)